MPLARTSLILLLIAAFTVDAFAIGFQAHHKNLVELIEAGDPTSAIETLEEIEALDEGQIFTANNYPYLAGRLFEKTGDTGTAARRYLEAAGPGSSMEVYALGRLSKVMRRSGNLPAERLFLLEALSLGTQSAASEAASFRLAHSWYESGNHDSAILSVRNRRHGTDGRLSREDQVLIGKAARRSGDTRTASESFTIVLESTPDTSQPDDLALAAVEGLDLLAVDEEEFGRRVLDLAPEEHFERANVFQHNRRFRLARLHYKALVERHPGDPRAPESAFQIGRGFVQERDYQHAIEWFERVLEQFPESEQAGQALYQAAGAYAALGKPKESIARFERFIDLNPGSERAADAYLNLIDVQRDSGESVLALKTADEMLARFPSGEGKASALFARARTHIAQEDWSNALADLESLGSMGYGTGVAGEGEFLRGYVLEKLGRKLDAARVYLGVGDGFRSFYGFLATERLTEIATKADAPLKARLASFASPKDGSSESLTEAAQAAFRLAVDQESRSSALEKLKETCGRTDGFRLPEAPRVNIPGRKEVRQRPREIGNPGHEEFADELLFLGLYDEAAVEYELHLLEKGSAKDEVETLAELYRKGGLVTRSVELAEGRWKEMPEGFVAEAMPESELRLLYPVPFRHEVLKYSSAEKLDPRFVLSIMRQESRFEPNVKSAAAARGLMQFIPSTASQIAEEIGIGDFVQDDLYDPAGAVRIGSRYLAKLFRDFPDQPAAVAASYNAGEDRVVRWYRRAGSPEPARYVPEIRFSQTRDYVAKVMNNYRIYRILYDENLETAAR